MEVVHGTLTSIVQNIKKHFATQVMLCKMFQIAVADL